MFAVFAPPTVFAQRTGHNFLFCAEKRGASYPLTGKEVFLVVNCANRSHKKPSDGLPLFVYFRGDVFVGRVRTLNVVDVLFAHNPQRLPPSLLTHPLDGRPLQYFSAKQTASGIVRSSKKTPRSLTNTRKMCTFIQLQKVYDKQ